ncbi:type 4b pilus protein PilO2 [Ralstonia insidiosa]|jgi:hypothetical protein|uniref:PilO family protein n=1 Tax=Ralstonia insidiosa TaxID=190721 RepID=A0A192A7J0_9RALS|nr:MULTISPECIES: type 4b pilus protein PilO2 [Ralstonia]KMW44831.1 hypothetical protein AC240_22990 [Ralstonia sp. MD27]ANJ76308.1 hypothetical protein A9Y76_27270 [Ralstonia insidiosa]MBA9869843.1 hypothetical protein [Ralstonia insidiosa]MBA9885052.1 hypothetical protein [Ralstonia pickettii]MBA9894831.1 hypothetical protein [Ralstonia pickettii]
MIIDVNGKKIAFGLAWKRLVGGGTPEAKAVSKAREVKSALIWTDAEALQVGLLPSSDLTEKEAAASSVPVYAAAKILSRIPGLKRNVLLVLNSPSKSGSFILIALYKGKPRDKFDLVDVPGDVVEQKVTEYREKLVGAEPFDIVGDVRGIEGLHLTHIGVLAEFADAVSVMHRPKAQLPLRKVAVGISLLVMVFATVQFAIPMGMRKWQEHRQKQQPDPQKLYDENIASVRSNPAVGAPELGPWYQWFRSRPWDIGGWHLTAATCTFTPASVMACSVDYKRSMPQATYMTFQAAVPDDWKSVYRFDGELAHVQTSSPVGQVQRIGALLDHAPAADAVTLNFGSLLQAYSVTGTYVLSPFALFGADGIEPSALQNTFRAAQWSMSGPVRNFELLSKFPAYATVGSINVQVSQPQTSINSSLFQVTVKGQVLVKG